MKPLSLSDGADLAGVTFRTARKRALAHGLVPIQSTPKSELFDSRELLRAIYAPEAADGDRLYPNQERARRDREAADKLALENAVSRGDLVPVSIWQQELEAFLGEIRAALLSLGARLAPVTDGDAAQRKDRIDRAVYEILGELAAYKPGTRSARRPKRD